MSPTTGDAPRGSVRVLVVDDEPSILELTRTLLERRGFQVATAGDGRQAMTELSQGRFDLILTDIIMPDMEGIELLRHLRAGGAGVPVIVMSGNPVGVKFLATARHLGAREALHKPFSVQELTEAIERALKR